MIKKKPLCPDRLRKITGSFAFIEHRFLRQGFFGDLNHHELLLYLFLVLVADRNGLLYSKEAKGYTPPYSIEKKYYRVDKKITS